MSEIDRLLIKINMLLYIQTLGPQEKQNAISSYLRFLEEEEKINLLRDNSFISWLERKTVNASFSYVATSPIDHFLNQDLSGISLIKALYGVADDFAKKYAIKPIQDSIDTGYLILHNGIGYKIGIENISKWTYYVRRVPIHNEADFILFEDIQRGRKTDDFSRNRS